MTVTQSMLRITEAAPPVGRPQRVFIIETAAYNLADSPGCTLEVFLTYRGQPLEAVDTERTDQGYRVSIEVSRLKHFGTHRLNCVCRGADNALLAFGEYAFEHQPTLAQPRQELGVATAAAHSHTDNLHIALQRADELGRPGVKHEITVEGPDCEEVTDVVFSGTIDLEDGCCKEPVFLVRSREGVRRTFVSLPPGLNQPARLRLVARRFSDNTLLDDRYFPIAVPAARADDPGGLDGPTPPPTPRPPTPFLGSVSLRRADRPATPNQDFYALIRVSARALSFDAYDRFLEFVFCGADAPPAAESFVQGAISKTSESRLRLPFPGTDAYRTLKAATEVFMLLNAGAVKTGKLSPLGLLFPYPVTLADEEARQGHAVTGTFASRIDKYLVSAGAGIHTLPYLDLIRRRLTGVDVVSTQGRDQFECDGIIQSRLTHPLLVELIWSYWMEEAMLAQTMLAISQRFQNRRSGDGRDPLAQLEIDPLRPFSSFMWGYAQDELHRLSVLRRAHEYEHQYGFSLQGKAVRDVRAADRRSKFLEAFHNLLYQCVQFNRADDDTTVIADGFPVLNALKETHYVLAEGAHNQWGDLTPTARQEMLIEQWMLSRPEMREFLGGRVMVPYPERWMDRVDTVKTLKGWNDVSVVHFRDLATYGEQIVLSVRWDAWSTHNEPEFAANWARYFRPEIQAYVHAYRAVTGIDLAVDITAQSQLSERYLPPSVHLTRRLVAQSQSRT